MVRWEVEMGHGNMEGISKKVLNVEKAADNFEEYVTEKGNKQLENSKITTLSE